MQWFPEPDSVSVLKEMYFQTNKFWILAYKFFLIPKGNCFYPILAKLLLPFKSKRLEGLETPLWSQKPLKASPVKLCKVIVLLKAYQSTKRNFQKYDLWRGNDVITINSGKFKKNFISPGFPLYFRKVTEFQRIRKSTCLINGVLVWLPAKCFATSCTILLHSSGILQDTYSMHTYVLFHNSRPIVWEENTAFSTACKRRDLCTNFHAWSSKLY